MKENYKDKVHFNGVQLTVFILGALLILGLIGYLSYKAVKLDKRPPQPEVTAVYQSDLPAYTYRVKVENKGGETASNMNLKMTLYQDGKSKESGTFSISYLPINSEQVGWMVFETQRKSTDSLVVSSLTFKALIFSPLTFAKDSIFFFSNQHSFFNLKLIL